MEFLYIAQNISKNIDKNISKNVSRKYSQILHDNTKHSATNALKTTLKEAIQLKTWATGHLIRNKIVDKVRKVSRTPALNF